MKPAIALALLALGFAPAALAQTPAPTAAPGKVVQIPAPAPGEQEKAESALRATFAAFAAGKPNYDDMEQPLADAVKQQSATLSAGLAALGPLKILDYQGYTPQRVWRYHGQFANGAADLMIGFGASGKIQTLWFKPVAV